MQPISVGHTATKPFPKNVYGTVDHGVVVQNQWYTVFDLRNVAVIVCGVTLGVSDETLEYRVTIDGVVWTRYGAINCTFGANPCTGLSYGVYLVGGAPFFTMMPAAASIAVANPSVPFWCKGRSVKVEVRKTTAAGAATLVSQYQVWQG